MRNVLRDIAWCVQDVLEAWFPLERVPSMWDLEAEALAQREAEEEVGEPRSGFNTATFRDPDPEPIDQLVALVEDIHNILQSSVALVSLAATETPDGSEHSTAPAVGPPSALDYADLQAAASGLMQWVADDPCPPHNHSAWRNIAGRLYNAADAVQ